MGVPWAVKPAEVSVRNNPHNFTTKEGNMQLDLHSEPKPIGDPPVEDEDGLEIEDDEDEELDEDDEEEEE